MIATDVLSAVQQRRRQVEGQGERVRYFCVQGAVGRFIGDGLDACLTYGKRPTINLPTAPAIHALLGLEDAGADIDGGERHRDRVRIPAIHLHCSERGGGGRRHIDLHGDLLRASRRSGLLGETEDAEQALIH